MSTAERCGEMMQMDGLEKEHATGYNNHVRGHAHETSMDVIQYYQNEEAI
jgi:hypothetical protein